MRAGALRCLGGLLVLFVPIVLVDQLGLKAGLHNLRGVLTV